MASSKAPRGRAAVERAAIRDHIEWCAKCALNLIYSDKPLELCAVGDALWDEYQQAKLSPWREALLTVAYNAAGEIVGVAGMDAAGLLALHNYLGTKALGCADVRCGCWEAGYERGYEAQREPLR